MENKMTPERALERLEEQAQDLYSEHCVELDKSYREKNEQAVKAIRQALVEHEKQKQILEVLKTKKVDIWIVDLSNNVKEYNNSAIYEKLTKIEFNLIKEWLK